MRSSSRHKPTPSRWLPFRSNKEPERYYLLPGMGGRLAFAKRKIAMMWALGLGTTTAAIVAVVIYFMSTR
jgi:hypothetical protein